jgi:hypothetical protein
MSIYIVIFLSFVLPWVVGVNIYHYDKKIILFLAPFSSMLSFLFNTPGIEYGLFYPTLDSSIKILTLSIIPNIGAFCILPCLYIYCIRHSKIKPAFLSIIFAAVGCIADLVYISAGYLKYDNGWNILLSCLCFFITLNIVYLYYLALKKYSVL